MHFIEKGSSVSDSSIHLYQQNGTTQKTVELNGLAICLQRLVYNCY